jgi:hypothetical protein
MGLSFLLKLFARDPDGGLLGYLKNRDNNNTRRAIEEGRNRVQLEMQRDRHRMHIELERERRKTAVEIVDHLQSGGEYRESTSLGAREIRKPPIPRATYLLPPEGSAQEPVPAELTEFLLRQARLIGLPKAAELPQGEDEGPSATDQ